MLNGADAVGGLLGVEHPAADRGYGGGIGEDLGLGGGLVGGEETHGEGPGIVHEDVGDAPVEEKVQPERLAGAHLLGQCCRPASAVGGHTCQRGIVEGEDARGRVVAEGGLAVARLQEMEAAGRVAHGEVAQQLYLPSGNGSQRMLAAERSTLQTGRRGGAHRRQSAVGFLHQRAVGSDADFAGQREVVGPAHLEVLLGGQLVGHDAQQQRLAVVLADGRREQSVAVAADASHLQILHVAGGSKLAVGADGTHPAECAHASAGAQRCADEENVSKILKELKVKEMDEVYLALGSLRYTPSFILNIITEEEKTSEEIVLEKFLDNKNRVNLINKGDVLIAGADEITVHFAKCCNPIKGDEIVGYITKNQGIMIHKIDCQNVKNKKERLIEATWNDAENNLYNKKLTVLINDSKNHMLDIFTLAAKRNYTIDAINTKETYENNLPNINYEIILKIHNVDEYNTFVKDLNNQSYVKEAY